MDRTFTLQAKTGFWPKVAQNAVFVGYLAYAIELPTKTLVVASLLAAAADLATTAAIELYATRK